jgi:hypothetical protein
MDPLEGPSPPICSCSSLHRPIGAPNTSSYSIRGKGKAYLFIAQIGRYNVALGAMFSLSMLEHVHSQHMSTLCTLVYTLAVLCTPSQSCVHPRSLVYTLAVLCTPSPREDIEGCELRGNKCGAR